MAELNDQGREVWFSRVAWSYMPAHWKGVACPLALIGVAVPLCIVADQFNDVLSLVPLLSVWGLLMWICERHSPSRR